MKGATNLPGAVKQIKFDNAQAEVYLAGIMQTEFDDLRPGAQKLVKKEFKDRPQDLQDFIVQKSPTGSISSEAQKAIDDMLAPWEAKRKQADNNVQYSFDTSNIYDYSKSFSTQIEDFKSGKIPQNDTLLVSGTPQAFRDIGFNALPVTINQTHVDYALNGTKDIDHALGETILKQLPEKLKTPIAVFKSKKHGSNRVVALLEFTHNRKSVIVPIEIDGYGRQNNIRIDSNAITSIFAKGNAVTGLLADAIQEEQKGNIALFHWDKKRAISLLQRAELQLPGGLPQDGSVHSIRENGANVNTRFENVTNSQQFKRWFGDWEKQPSRASKVVNADGTPKVVYHGTNGDFWIFDRNYIGKYDNGTSAVKDIGFFFTDDKALALDHAEGAAYEDGEDNSRIIEAYIDIKYPLVVTVDEYYARRKYYDAQLWYDKNRRKILEMFNDGDYDGIIIKNPIRADNLYIVMEPTQIKSATDNIGTFDGNNPDIRYRFGKESSSSDAAVTAIPIDTQITPETTGAVQVDAPYNPRVKKLGETIYNKTGIRVGFAEYYNNGEKVDGYKGHYDPTTKTIYFNPNATAGEMLYGTAIHELTHSIERSKHYNAISRYVIDQVYGGTQSEAYTQAIQDKIKEYATYGKELEPQEAHRELVAQSVKDIVFASEEDVRRIVAQDYSFAQRIQDWIGTILYRIRSRFGYSSESKQILADLEQAQRNFRLALAEGKRNNSGVWKDSAIDNAHANDIMNTAKNKSNYYIRQNQTRITYDPRGLKLPTAEYAKLRSSINTDYFNKNKTHKALQYQSCVTDKTHNFYVYEDYGYDSFRVVAKIDYANEDVAIAIMEAIEREASYGITRVINYVLKTFEVRQSGYTVYNARTKERISARSNGIISTRSFESDTRRVDDGSGGVSRNKRNNSELNSPPSVKNEFAFSSTQSAQDTEFQKGLDDFIVPKPTQQEDAAPAPKAPEDANGDLAKDVLEVVNDPWNKRTDDIELQYSQRLKGEHSMMFKDLPRVLDYVCDKMPGVRKFWYERLEKPFAQAKASFASRTRQTLTEYKQLVDSLDIRIGSKESAAAQWYGEGYRTVWVKLTKI